VLPSLPITGFKGGERGRRRKWGGDGKELWKERAEKGRGEREGKARDRME